MPALDALLRDRRSTALYLSPTKALANDQLRAIQGLGLDPGGRDGFRASTFDGDTPVDERDWVREHSRWRLSSPGHAQPLTARPRSGPVETSVTDPTKP